MRSLKTFVPALTFLDSPNEEMARLSLALVRRENRFLTHRTIWIVVSTWLLVMNLIVEPRTLVPSILLAGIWGIFVFFHSRRAFKSGRRRYEQEHRDLARKHRESRGKGAGERGVAMLRQRLLRAAEEARGVLRNESPETVAEVARGETEALALVAWLDEAEALVEKHRLEPWLRREVAKRLSDPRNRPAREPLENLLREIDYYDVRLATLEREIDHRRRRVESFLLAIENVKIAHSGGGLLPAVSASIKRRVELLEEGDDAAGTDSAADAAARIREEVRLAQDLQRSILPGDAPEIPGLRVAHVYRPSNEVGGDFYDFYVPGPDRLLVALGDASGHGLDSSMVSSMAKSALYMQMSAGHGMAESMVELNHMMCDTLGRRRFMTLALVELDLDERRISWVNAGQVYPLLRRGRDVIELEQPGYPLGVRRETAYMRSEAKLEPGDFVLLLTDGYVEAANHAGEPYGWDRLSERLRNLEDDLDHALGELAGDLSQHLGTRAPQDDVTLIAVHFDP